MISCRFPSAAVFLIKKRTRRKLPLQSVSESHPFHQRLPLCKGTDSECKSFLTTNKSWLRCWRAQDTQVITSLGKQPAWQRLEAVPWAEGSPCAWELLEPGDAQGRAAPGAATEPLTSRWPSWGRVVSAGLLVLSCAGDPPGTQDKELQTPSRRHQGTHSPSGCTRKDILPYNLWYFRLTSSKNDNILNDSKDKKLRN